MPKVRDVLTHVSVETADRRRICHRNRNEHSIAKGNVCLVIKDAATGGKKNYCTECAEPILTDAQSRVAELLSQLGLN
jgi:hypothetical protein